MGDISVQMKVTSREQRKFMRKPWQPQEAVAGAVGKKAGRYYAAEDTKKKLNNHHNNNQTKLRASITPGTVLILLAGRFKGQRVVFLKQLDSGLLLISGPYAINGVPLRRVPQSYVIATQTKIDISGVAVPAEVDDAFFKKEQTKTKKDADTLMGDNAKESTVTEYRKATQKKVDDKIVAAIGKVELLKEYMSSKFSLKKGQKPHEMTF